jgi:hypothetical protein
LARLRKHFPVETTKHSFCIVVVVVVVVVDQHVIVKNTKILNIHNSVLWSIYVTDNNANYTYQLFERNLSQLIRTLSDIVYKQSIAKNE